MFQHLFTYLAVFICTLNTAYSIGDSFFGSYAGSKRVISSHTTSSQLSSYETRAAMKARFTAEKEELQQEIATLKHNYQQTHAQEQKTHQQIVHTLQALLMACNPQEGRVSRMLTLARKNPTPEDQSPLSFAGNVGNAKVSALLDEALHEEEHACPGLPATSAQEESCHGETQANLINTAHKDLLVANIKEALKETP